MSQITELVKDQEVQELKAISQATNVPSEWFNVDLESFDTE